jgi:hypothetical protein
MDYFDKFDNGLLNKYKTNFKNKKVYRFIFLLLDWWSFKFHVISLSFDDPANIIIFFM